MECDDGGSYFNAVTSAACNIRDTTNIGAGYRIWFNLPTSMTVHIMCLL